MVEKAYLAYPDDPNSWYVVHTCRKKPKYIHMIRNQITWDFYEIDYKSKSVECVKKCRFCDRNLDVNILKK